MAYKHLFCDMDGTITPSRSKISSEIKAFLTNLEQSIGVISGSHNRQMEFQVDGLKIIKMGQNGNHTIDIDGTELWFDKIEESEKAEILDHIKKVWALCDQNVPDKADLIEDRGSQISLSIYGHHADPEAKKAFDGDFVKRKALLEAVPFESETIEVRLGGSTCLDYFKKGKNKGYNIARLISHKGWKREECIFFGDALFPGGNDETVVGVIETISVANSEDMVQKVKNKLRI